MKRYACSALIMALCFMSDGYPQECKPATFKANIAVNFRLTKLDYDESGNLDADDILDNFYDNFEITFSAECLADVDGITYYNGNWERNYSFINRMFTLHVNLNNSNGNSNTQWSALIDMTLYPLEDDSLRNYQNNASSMAGIKSFTDLPSLRIDNASMVTDKQVLSYGATLSNIRKIE